MTAPQPITVIIQSRNRPLYLWACLDSLFCYTRHPARFILIDNNSDDPMVREVVRGFERRGLFHRVEWYDTNDPERILKAVRTYVYGPSGKLVVIDSDVMVFDTCPCWLTRMSRLMDENPDLGLLGSYVDTRDFIPLEEVPALLPDKTPEEADALVKAHSPERSLPENPPEDRLIESRNLPGRLLMVRKDALQKLKYSIDREVSEQAREVGFRIAIAPGVKHRHLSLVNAYDYPDYDMEARRRHFEKSRTRTPVIPD